MRDLFRSTNNKSDDKKFMKIKLNSDKYLPLKKTLELHDMIIVVFHEGNKYYRQVFSDEFLSKS